MHADKYMKLLFKYFINIGTSLAYSIIKFKILPTEPPRFAGGFLFVVNMAHCAAKPFNCLPFPMDSADNLP